MDELCMNDGDSCIVVAITSPVIANLDLYRLIVIKVNDNLDGAQGPVVFHS